MATPPATPEAALAHVRAHWASIQPKSPIYNLFFGDIRIIAATPGPGGRILARLPVVPIHVNSKSILHGAVSAALVDWAGGMAIAAATGRSGTGVSVDIHISYVSAARAGDTLEIEAWVQRAGQSLAYTAVEIRKAGADVDDETAAAALVAGSSSGSSSTTTPAKGPVVASGSHTKYLNIPPPKAASTASSTAATTAASTAN